MPTHKLTPEIINAAIVGFEQQKNRIDAQIAELRAMLDVGRTAPVATPEVPKGKRRKMSAAARKRMGDAQRKRWAEAKGQPVSPSKTDAVKQKRKLSAAGKAAIVAALKKRWAAKKAAAAVAVPAAAKKAAAKTVLAKSAARKISAKKAARGPVQLAKQPTA